MWLEENYFLTKDALLHHIKRSILHAGIWSTSNLSQPPSPDPDGGGWTMRDNKWSPVWMTLPEAAKTCTELIKCGCKSERGCRTCECAKLEFACTALCSCTRDK